MITCSEHVMLSCLSIHILYLPGKRCPNCFREYPSGMTIVFEFRCYRPANSGPLVLVFVPFSKDFPMEVGLDFDRTIYRERGRSDNADEYRMIGLGCLALSRKLSGVCESGSRLSPIQTCVFRSCPSLSSICAECSAFPNMSRDSATIFSTRVRFL
jgi:hypothetical protein